MIISVVNHKGGTGKTASTSNVGSALALMNYKVLLIDLDPQGNLSYSFGISDDTLSIYEVFTGENSIEDVIVRKEGLDILPSNIRLSDIELSVLCKDNSMSDRRILEGRISNPSLRTITSSIEFSPVNTS